MFKLAQADGVLDEAEILLFHFAHTAATANGLHVLTASEFQTNTLSKYVSPFSATYDVPASDAVTSVRDERLMDHCEGGHHINTLCYGPNTNGSDGLEEQSFCTLCLIVDSFRFFLSPCTENLYKVDGDPTLLAELRTLTNTLKVFCTTGMQDMETRASKWTVMDIASPVG
ncbi:hypothetical protein GYMLUDRAFT_261632 [Collybiopsis luxurians FD-317 M1]|uniref:Uncharacterized protein n=1 Tax=Collybiopsis luxurians FD-317 M1 TaxID=944289 RepID=A0A0D0CVL7_9AGAR|nr:hypothetical protein GYMLUDRAFT_261632 [Collybiopsis luxurians FD-317 M1]